jgi:outer membrane lipoprotein-sorting protein
MKPILGIIFLVLSLWSNAQSAKDVVRLANEAYRGKTSVAQITMKIVRPKWERTYSIKSWSKGDDFSMALIIAPAKEKGQAFLKRGNDLWNWMPTLNRMIKMPPSMMSQGWMGSDVSNDDMLRQSSLVDDYDQSFGKSEIIDGRECWNIMLTPKPQANVMWGKIVLWISKKGYLIMKQEYYDEDGTLAHSELCSEIKTMGNREITSKIEIIPAENPNQKTILIIDNIVFDKALDDSFFSEQNMKTLK